MAVRTDTPEGETLLLRVRQVNPLVILHLTVTGQNLSCQNNSKQMDFSDHQILMHLVFQSYLVYVVFLGDDTPINHFTELML